MRKYINLYDYTTINKKASKITCFLVRVKGVEPPRLAALDPKSSASTNSAIPAKLDRTNILFFNIYIQIEPFKDFKK